MFLAHFWSISQFWGLKTFSGESSSVTHKFVWISSTRPKLEKANDKIPKRLDGRTKGWRTGPISKDHSRYRRGSNQIKLFSVE